MTGSKYKYEGIPLREYCQTHGLNVATQRNRIKTYLNEHPEVGIDEATKIVLDRCGKVFYKYSYDGKSLAEYCREKKLPYSKMVSRVESIKEKNPELSDLEATRIAIEETNDNGIKLFYDGIPLVEYCEKHPEYKYGSVLTYLKRARKKYPDKDTQEIIDSYFLMEHQSHTYHFIDGKPLYDYCDEFGIVYSTILSSLSSLRKNPKYSSLTEQERLQIALKNYQKHVYLYYKGETLHSYCKRNDYSYNTVYNYIFKYIKENSGITLEEAMDIAFASIKRFGIKYYYDGKPLIEYCRKHDLNEWNVRNRVTDSLKNPEITVEEAVQESIQFYEKKKYFDDLRKIFSYLRENTEIDEFELKKILEFLNMDYENVIQMSKIYSNLSDTVNLIWYFHDNEDNKKLSISIDCLKKIIEDMKKLETMDDSKIIEIDIFFLIGLYKSNLFDTRYLLILHQENYHLSRIRYFLNYYALQVGLAFEEELKDSLNLLLLELIDRNCNNEAGMIVSYLQKSIDGFILNYLLQYRIELSKVISLDTPIDNSSNSRKRVLLDKVATKEELGDHFSGEMLELLNQLDDVEKSYILYKFQMCLPDEEIATLLKLSLEELEIFSKTVLLKLKESEGIKVLFYSRKD